MSDESSYPVTIESVGEVTHDVRRFVIARPDGYTFEPGQATEVRVDEEAWRDQPRPFTFTSLPDNPRLELTVKIYPDHDGVTERMGDLAAGDRLILGDAWGAITYTGPGTFIAGGAGVTPFIAILRDLEQRGELDGQRLLFSNKTADDIILEGEFTRMLGDDFICTLTREENDRYHHGRIDADFIESHAADLDQPVYLCGPPEMVEDLSKVLADLGVDSDGLVVEE
ncbi:MAG: hypothetical protein R3336_10445 [Phycisphaeraceae bacterium]|nr:hypothetical protein [Phycisphaeraceae bacterium]